MTANTETVGGNATRIGMMSRLDFPSDGWRRFLTERAKEIFARADVHFVVLAGGLVAERYVREKSRNLQKRINEILKPVKILDRAIDKIRKKIVGLEAKIGKPRTKKEDVPNIKKAIVSLKKELKDLEKECEKLAAPAVIYQQFLDELKPENLAAKLAQQLPRFVNAKGKPVKLYVFPSPAYDGEIGERVAQILAEMRRDDVRVYRAGVDRLPIKQAGKIVEVLVAEKNVWMRGDYFSTPVERVLKDRNRVGSGVSPDIQIIGCFGSTITKPAGEAQRPFVTVPALHVLQQVRVNENQIGVRVMTVYRDRTDPEVRNHSFKDLIGREREFYPLPAKVSAELKAILESIRTQGPATLGMLADDKNVGLARTKIEAELTKMTNHGYDRPKDWSGLRFDRKSQRWDFDSYWLRENLQYPALPEDRIIDSIVAFGCVHASNVFSDMDFFLRETVKAVLERNANVFIGAGDFIEGLKHDLILRKEVYAGFNNTQQEQLAGRMVGYVVFEVFKARFAKLLTEKPNGLKADDLAKAIEDSLVTFVFIAGNHDDWQRGGGNTPLSEFWHQGVRWVTKGVRNLLNAKGYSLPNLSDLVERKFIEVTKDGNYVLPSGLKVNIRHPCMGRTKTTSIRPQEMLDKASHAHLVVGANFHVGEHLEVHENKLGQRVCLQLGTICRLTQFEEGKLKTVDHGFGYIRLESVDGRLICTENTFYSAPPQEGSMLDPDKPFNDLLQAKGLDEPKA